MTRIISHRYPDIHRFYLEQRIKTDYTDITTTDSTDYMDYFENNGLRRIARIILIIKKNI